MDKSYFSIKSLPPSCSIASKVELKEWAYRLDRGLGNGDNLLQWGEVYHFFQLYQTSPSFKDIPYWKWVGKKIDQWGNGDGKSTPSDFGLLFKQCAAKSWIVSSKGGEYFELSYDPNRKKVDVKFLEKVWIQTRQTWTVNQWAAIFPNAKVRGKGKTLSQLATEKYGKHSLGEAFVDRHGDLDVTHFGTELLKKWGPSYILRKRDDPITSFPYFARHSRLLLKFDKIPQQYRRALHALSTFPNKPLGGDLFIDLSRQATVTGLLTHPELRPLFFPFLLKKHLIKGSTEDRARTLIVMALDFKGAELWYDESLINNPDLNRKWAKPTLHASIKINPSHLNQQILIYTPLYSRSNPPQGKRNNGKLKLPKRGYVHQGDSESVYFLLDIKGKLQEIFGDTHYYLSRATKKQVEVHSRGISPTFSVSFLAHGNQLAQEKTVEVEARTGSLRGGSAGHLYDVFPGWEELAQGKAVRITPRVIPDLVAMTQIHTQIGKTIGVSGIGFNDGIRFRRLRTDRWTYNTDPIFEHIEREKRGLLDQDFQISLSYYYGSFNTHHITGLWVLPFPKQEGLMFSLGLGAQFQYAAEETDSSLAFHLQGSMGYGFGPYYPYLSLGLNVPYLSYVKPDKFGLSLGLEMMLYPVSFRFDNLHIRAGGGVQLNLPRLFESDNFQFGTKHCLKAMAGVGMSQEF